MLLNCNYIPLSPHMALINKNKPYKRTPSCTTSQLLLALPMFLMSYVGLHVVCHHESEPLLVTKRQQFLNKLSISEQNCLLTGDPAFHFNPVPLLRDFYAPRLLSNCCPSRSSFSCGASFNVTSQPEHCPSPPSPYLTFKHHIFIICLTPPPLNLTKILSTLFQMSLPDKTTLPHPYFSFPKLKSLP